MFNAGGAVVTEELLPPVSAPAVSLVSGNGEIAGVAMMVKGSGRFMVHCSLRPTAVLFEGAPIEFTHGEHAETGVSALEVVLPRGFTGVPRQLLVQWGEASPRAGIMAGSPTGVPDVATGGAGGGRRR
ncbi:unnamed protein product [Sphacelaria rigidula]